MFEKEAGEIVKRNVCEDCNKCQSHGYIGCDIYRYSKDSCLYGLREGYNKANEWHYVKDVNCYEDLHFPPEEEEKGRLLIWKVQVITEKGIKQPVCYHCGSYGDLWYEINAYHVIAWKEIVLPKEIE